MLRAEDWGLDKPIITGELKVMQKGDDCLVRLFDTSKDKSDAGGVLFAECPIKIDETFKKRKLEFYVENVVDSSRYFVLRVEVSSHEWCLHERPAHDIPELKDSKSGRHAYLGMGS